MVIAGDRDAYNATMEIHILEYSRAVDYERLVEQLRSYGKRPKSG